MALPKTAAERKRVFELVAIVIITLLLIGISRLETRLFELSETLVQSKEFINTLVYFGLINLNVFLILILFFLLFRNFTKLVIDRRRGVIGSKLRTKLVVALLFFSLAPTLLFFYVSARFINESFDQWFSDKVRSIMVQTQEAGAKVYKRDQQRHESLARIALARIKITMPDETFIVDQPAFTPNLEGFELEYGLDNVKVFDISGNLVWSSREQDPGTPVVKDPFAVESIALFNMKPGMYAKSMVTGEGSQDVVKGIAPIVNPTNQELLGAVMTETYFQTQILKSVKEIQKSFVDIRRGAKLIRLSYLNILIVVSLLVLFSAVWLGFYVARGITRPIQILAEATREVALGNYNVTLTPKTDDEAGQLIRSFNLMTKDLEKHRTRAREDRDAMELTNIELEQRRKYMEIVLKHISAGVISVDSKNFVTAMNSAAESLLDVAAVDVVGRKVKQAFPEELNEKFWKPIDEKLLERNQLNAQINLSRAGRELLLLVDASPIIDEQGIQQGYVLVFADATERVKAQRVAAWREVARRIAHEIKNPVTPIKLSAQRMLRRFHDKFEGEDQKVFEVCVETILKQVDSLRDLVNEFSKFSRLPEVRPKMANLNSVIKDSLNFFEMSYPNVKFIFTPDEELPNFPLDADQMNRVFVNIIANAVAALDDDGGHGTVEVKATMVKKMNTVKIEIIDNGQGIPEKLRDRVLEPYFSTKDEGTGLGLAIVNQIVSDHGGYLRILGNIPKGTIVTIELPVGVSVELLS